jgi:glyoxalase family protein
MNKKINGLHHITALAGDPQTNYNFYTKILGLRFVKKTVNFDAPEVYHFYFADEVGTPGTVLTFFPFPNAKRGVRGYGEANIVSFSICSGSMDFWINRLSRYEITFDGPKQKFEHSFISLLDPDGLKIELVEDRVDHLIGWETKEIPRVHSIRKFFGTTINLHDPAETEKLITNILGFRLHSQNGNRKRYISGEGDSESKFDVEFNSNSNPAIQSAGSVHHIAWRAENDEVQLGWLKKLRENGYHTTDVIDRNYFRSIYFRTPGGVLFEIATDQPGFMIDEEKQDLGKDLKLPDMYEFRREEIENILIPLNQ